jgi:hypothetical protein
MIYFKIKEYVNVVAHRVPNIMPLYVRAERPFDYDNPEARTA